MNCAALYEFWVMLILFKGILFNWKSMLSTHTNFGVVSSIDPALLKPLGMSFSWNMFNAVRRAY